MSTPPDHPDEARGEQRGSSDASRGRGSNPTSGGPTRADAVTDRFEELNHELASLLDGSMRCLGLASRDAAKLAAAAGEDADAIQTRVHQALRGLERMAEALQRAMKTTRVGLGNKLSTGESAPVSLLDAATHAVEMLRFQAFDSGVALRVDVHDAIADEPAGAIYPVLLNGLRNAIEAVGVCGGSGEVTVRARRNENGRHAVLEIEDDGCGPPGENGDARVFDAGFSTKPDGGGIGLGVARSVVEHLGGSIELVRGASTVPGRPGAILRVTYPLGQNRPDSLDRRVGKTLRDSDDSSAIETENRDSREDGDA
ncbi:MAG: HAMP domain-containing sensor histidine kinase [Planctomycetota bacterium]